MNRQLLQEMRINKIILGLQYYVEVDQGYVYDADGMRVPLEEYMEYYLDEGTPESSVPLDKSTWNEINRFLGMEITRGELARTIRSDFRKQFGPWFFDDEDEIAPELIKYLEQKRSEAAEKNMKNLADHRLLSSRNVEIAIDQFRQMADIDLISRGEFTKFMNIGYSCAKAICLETLHGDFTHDISGRHRRGVGIATSDNTSGGRYGRSPLYLGVLSSGTQGTLVWIWALVATMATHYYWDSE